MTKEEIQKNSEHWYNKYKDAEKRIAELEKEKQGLKDYCDRYTKTILSLRQNVEELEKENAELKSENRRMKTCTNCDEYVIGRCCNYPNGVCQHWKLSEKYRNDDKLTKAKEIIREIMKYDIPTLDYEKAEQFLKEIEK